MKPSSDKVTSAFLRRKVLYGGFIPGYYEDAAGCRIDHKWMNMLAKQGLLFSYWSEGSDVRISPRGKFTPAHLYPIQFPVRYKKTNYVK